jgi:CBS domain-containing protein
MDVHTTKVRELMHEGCTCIPHDASCADAARRMREEAVGALPICGPDDRLVGMLTDRDIVVGCIAMDRDPAECMAGELASGRVIWTFDDALVGEALASMEEHLVRRLPVIDRSMRLVGMLSQADVARHLDRAATGELLEVISAAEPRRSAAY